MDRAFRTNLSLFGAGFALVAGLAACTDRSGDLQRRVTFLQDELDDVRAELETANRKAPADAEAPPTVDAPARGASETAIREQIARSFETAARAFRSDMESQLPDFHLDALTRSEPRIDSFPFRAEFSLEARAGGRRVQIREIPAKAKFDGAWLFPTVPEVTAMIERVKNGQPSAAAVTDHTASPARTVRGTSPPTDRPESSGVAAPAAADRTVVVRWGDERRAPAEENPPSAPREVRVESAPAEPAEPTRVMPSNRDVVIKF